MKRQLLLALGVLLLLAGWLSAFLLTSIPQNSTLYLLIPTLLLGVGMGVLAKTVGNRLMALTLALTALTALLSLNQIFPNRGVGFDAFNQEAVLQEGTAQPLRVIEESGDSINSAARKLEAFAPIRVRRFAQLPAHPRMMAFGPEGRLFVSLPKLGAIYLLEDRDGDGFAEQPQLYHAGMDRPHGLLWYEGNLLVAETGSLLELNDADGDNSVDQVRTLVDGLPDDGGHWTRSLALAPDGHIYLSVGSRCNACEEADPRRASVLKIDPESGEVAIFARGLRNSVGLAVAPDSGLLWGSDNGRDMLGDELPPDEINRIVAGGDYGWPRCFGQQQPDPEHGTVEACRETIPSQVDLPAHTAPLGIAFGHSLDAPEKYRNSLYVASHGSWNRSVPRGYKLIRIPYQDGQIAEVGHEFLRGWLQRGQAWGRPVDPVVGPEGNLYLSDDRADLIYRISWQTRE